MNKHDQTHVDTSTTAVRCDLSNDDISRYSRQLVLSSWGPLAQQRVCASRVLIIGAGGLGCPSAMYLAGAGVGSIGIIDHDTVERSNLHRQIAHLDDRVGQSKAESLRRTCLSMNPTISIRAYAERFCSDNAFRVVADYDLIVDATDNVESRYLINDVAVLSGKPLVSGAALGLEGQLSVYNLKDGPCYRCVFPVPPPLHLVGDCSNGGVLGPVPGVIGTLQAIEALKVLADLPHLEPLRQRLMVMDTSTMCSRTVRLRGRQSECSVCGPNEYRNRDDHLAALVAAMPKRTCPAQTMDSKADAIDDNISVEAYAEVRRSGEEHVLVDVREPHQFGICSLPGAINVPIRQLSAWAETAVVGDRPVFVMCRRGVLSKKATSLLREQTQLVLGKLYNVSGGLTAWTKNVDPSFPLY